MRQVFGATTSKRRYVTPALCHFHDIYMLFSPMLSCSPFETRGGLILQSSKKCYLWQMHRGDMSLWWQQPLLPSQWLIMTVMGKMGLHLLIVLVGLVPVGLQMSSLMMVST